MVYSVLSALQLGLPKNSSSNWGFGGLKAQNQGHWVGTPG